MKPILATTLALGVLALAACGNGPISGTYGTQAENGIQLVFSGDNVTMTKDGQSVTMKYKLEGSKITLIKPGVGVAPAKLHFDPKGCIRDPYALINGAACKQ